MRKADLLAYLLLGFVVLVPTYLLLSPISEETASWIWAALPLAVIVAITMLVDDREAEVSGIRPLKRFIAKALRKGHSIEEIQQSLLSCGWPAQMVERAFAARGMLVTAYVAREMKSLDDPLEPLREFIRAMEEHGASALIIRDQLLSAGWSEEAIDPVISETMKRDRAVIQTLVWFGKQNV